MKVKIKTCADLRRITQKLKDKAKGYEPDTVYAMAVLDLSIGRLDEYVEQVEVDNSLLSDESFQKKFDFVFNVAMNYLGVKEL